MYIYTQLFQEAKSEDELAAVMAHEFAHVYGRHVHKGMNRQYGVLAAAAALGAGGYVAGGKEKGQEYAGYGAGLGMIAGQLATMGFTRKDEAEADSMGFDFYTHAGWNPNKFADFFKTMIAKGLDKGSEFMSDHPSLKSRVDAAEERAGKLPPQAKQWARPPVAGPARFQELQARAAKLGKTLPDDKTLSSQKLLQALPRSCIAPVDPPDALQARQEIVQKAQAVQAQEQQRQAAPAQSPAPVKKKKRTATPAR